METWIKATEKLPTENELFLCWDDYHKMITTCVFNPHHECWDDEFGDDYYTSAVGGKITHWMHLPNRPENT